MGFPAPNSLRLRLILAFMAMVGLTLFVGVTSFVMHREIREQVSVLRPGQGVDLGFRGLDYVGLEVEGFWSSQGTFVATSVEALTGMRRPKLRGAIQAVDVQAETVTLYGLSIDVSGLVEVDEEPVRNAVAQLSPGQRIEVTCDVKDGSWLARKVRLRDVKSSDKIKGTMEVRRAAGTTAPDLVIHGLVLSLESLPEGSLQDTSQDIATATRLMLALLECRSESHALAADVPTSGAVLGLRQAHRDFELALSNGSDHHSKERIVALMPEFEHQITELERITANEPANVSDRVEDVFTPFLKDRLQPAIAIYFSEAEEELGERLRSVASRTRLTTRIAIVTSAVAAVVALLLGILVWRSIHTPLQALQAAARQLGHGHLDTRVNVNTRDELGELATAFNQMATELAATTMSIDNLENVFGSMAGALVLVNAEFCITTANQAALDLLGYSSKELAGRPLELICAGVGADGLGASLEVDMTCKSGAQVPVSLSVTELRSTDNTLQGYVCLAQDLTQRHLIEAEIRDALAEKELLLREVYHRVKNNMQVVSSMLAMQSDHSSDAQLVASLEQSQARIRSMALIHEQLYQSVDLTHIDVRTYLNVLTQHLSQSFGRGNICVLLCLDDVELDLDRSLACGLIVNELVTNAYAHAFPKGHDGTIHVSLSRVGAEEVELSVADDGCGLSASLRLEETDTLGMNLVATLSEQLGGAMNVDRVGGVRVSIRFPRRSAPRLVV